jgi:hypothetical protein
MDYTERYLALAKSDRRGTERFIAQREELKTLMSRKQGPMTDAQLREMAATRAQSVRPEEENGLGQAAVVGETPSKTASNQAVPTKAPSGNSRSPAAVDVNTDDAKALEEAIK